MTSPNQEFPKGAYTSSTIFGMQNVTQKSVGQSQAADMKVLLDQVQATFINNLLGGFGDVVGAIGAAINKFISDLVYGLKGITGGFIDLTGFLQDTDTKATNAPGVAVDQIGGALTGSTGGGLGALVDYGQNVFGRDVSLASRVAVLENKIAVGAEYYDNFKRGDNPSTLGSPDPGKVSNWIQFGDGEQLGIRDQAAQMVMNSPFPDDGTRYAQCPFLPGSSDYTVAAVINPSGTPQQPSTSLYGRCNSTMTEGIFVRMKGDRTYLGRFTRSGTSITRTVWAETSKRYSNSSTPQLRMVGNRYQVIIDDIVILDYTDSGSVFIDTAHRTSGFSVECWTAILAVPQFSAGLASFAVRGTDLTAVQAAVTTASNAYNTAVGADTKATDAKTAADAVVGTANDAKTAADEAKSTADAVASTANTAKQTADQAFAAANRWKDEFVVASAGVLLGKNEILLGMVMDVPQGRRRYITRLIFGMVANSGGNLTMQLVRVAANATSESVAINGITIPSGTRRYVYNLETALEVFDLEAFHINVTAASGVNTVLQCALVGVIQ